MKERKTEREGGEEELEASHVRVGVKVCRMQDV